MTKDHVKMNEILDNKEVTEELERRLKINNIKYMPLSQLKRELPKKIKNFLNLDKKENRELKETFEPFLGNNLKIIKKIKEKKTTYYLFDDSKKDDFNSIAFEYIINNLTKSIPTIVNQWPFSKKWSYEYINSLLNKKTFKVFFNENGTSFFLPFDLSPQHSITIDEVDIFKQTYFELENGRGFVKIFEIRRKIGWDNKTFDALIKKLLNQEKIVLKRGDPTKLSSSELSDSYDANNFRYIALSWREE